jgi:hypothetical protein
VINQSKSDFKSCFACVINLSVIATERDIYHGLLTYLVSYFFMDNHYSSSNSALVPLFLSVDASTFFTRPGITQAVNLFNNIGNTYVAAKHWDNKTTLLFGVGATTYQKNHLIFNTGLRYLSTSDILLNGNIWQLNQTQFNNLSYNYRVKSDLLLVENAISWAKHIVQPSFILGFGYAENTASAYQGAPLYSHAATALQVFTDKKPHSLLMK